MASPAVHPTLFEPVTEVTGRDGFVDEGLELIHGADATEHGPGRPTLVSGGRNARDPMQVRAARMFRRLLRQRL